jgi:hypothetical protein
MEIVLLLENASDEEAKRAYDYHCERLSVSGYQGSLDMDYDPDQHLHVIYKSAN